eukprot:TRINITY_DN668_c0_g1_i3.p2 TRINITY_DN668_c0_g1~~TRINITY_DN668_c0_g1_i3.p2  ORF type:complete len:148 (+),score=17.12 TRINITY_DN668_c0_g1_i3:1378-1821(+)
MEVKFRTPNGLTNPLVCNMCNTFATFVIARDYKMKYRFASLQSQFARDKLKKLGVPNDLSTVVLVEKGTQVFTKSDAVLRIARDLSFPWWIVSYLIYLPRPVRDLGYWCVANTRYSLWGKKKDEDACVYVPAWRDRFLADADECADK